MSRRCGKSTAPTATGKRNAIRRIPLLSGSAFLDSRKGKEKYKERRPVSFCAVARHLSLADAGGRISDGLRACGESSTAHRAPRPLQSRRPASTFAARPTLDRSHEVHAHVMAPTAFRPSSCASDAAGPSRAAPGPVPDGMPPHHRRLQAFARSPRDLHETCRSRARARAANCPARDSHEPHGAPISRPRHRPHHPGRPTRARLDRTVKLWPAIRSVPVRSFSFEADSAAKPVSLAAGKGCGNGPCREYLRRRDIRQTIPEKSGSKAARLRKGSRGRGPLGSTESVTGNAVPWNGRSPAQAVPSRGPVVGRARLRLPPTLQRHLQHGSGPD